MKAKICNIIRKHWHVKLMSLLILLFLAFMPIIINWLYGFEAPYKCFREPSEWTVFWGSYISGIASVAMLIVTWLTLYKTIERHKEEDKPKIAFSIIRLNDNDYEIEIVNYGHNPAVNLKLAIIIPTPLREKFDTYLIDDSLEFPANGLEIVYPNTKVRKPLFKTKDKRMCLYGCIQIDLDEDMLSEIIKYHALYHIEVEYCHDSETKKKTSLTFPFVFWE